MATKQISDARWGALPALLCVLMLFLLMSPFAAEAATSDAAVQVPPVQETAKPDAKTGETQPTMIVGLGSAGTPAGELSLSMGDALLVRLDGTAPLNAADWSLLLDGHEIPGLAASTVVDDASHGLLFNLRRTDKSKESWNAILGSPTMSREITVALARTGDKDKIRLQTAAGAPPAKFQLDIISGWWFFAALVFAVLVILGTYWAATRTAILRDAFLVQIPPTQRTFSLGRCQMAFWFVLVVGSFLFLWLLLWDYNTLNAQAISLMGISAATGLAAIVVNTGKSEATNKANTDLQNAKFFTSDDIVQRRDRLAKAQAELKKPGLSEADQQTLKDEIGTLGTEIASYDRIVKDYVSATYVPSTGGADYRKIMDDLINDDSGPTLHRLQMVAWTVVLGIIFLVGIYRDLTMPEFSSTLLALMAFTGTAYVGCKIPEKTPDKPS